MELLEKINSDLIDIKRLHEFIDMNNTLLLVKNLFDLKSTIGSTRVLILKNELGFTLEDTSELPQTELDKILTKYGINYLLEYVTLVVGKNHSFDDLEFLFDSEKEIDRLKESFTLFLHNERPKKVIYNFDPTEAFKICYMLKNIQEEIQQFEFELSGDSTTCQISTTGFMYTDSSPNWEEFKKEVLLYLDRKALEYLDKIHDEGYVNNFYLEFKSLISNYLDKIESNITNQKPNEQFKETRKFQNVFKNFNFILKYLKMNENIQSHIQYFEGSKFINEIDNGLLNNSSKLIIGLINDQDPNTLEVYRDDYCTFRKINFNKNKLLIPDLYLITKDEEIKDWGYLDQINQISKPYLTHDLDEEENQMDPLEFWKMEFERQINLQNIINKSYDFLVIDIPMDFQLPVFED